MGRILTIEDKVLRPHLIEYDRNNPSPLFSNEQIRFIESRQDGLSEAELSWIRDYEYFIFNKHYPRLMICRIIPGLRARQSGETRYVMRYGTADYSSMMNDFISCVPPDLRKDLNEYCNMPGCRLTTPDGNRFYPINYHEDIAGWRRLISESAEVHGTLTALFEGGKFLLSDGQRINFSDLTVASLDGQDPCSPDW